MKGADGRPLNISAFTASWTLQMGFPVIKVNRQGSNIIIEQKRFKLDSDAKEKPQYQETKYGYGSFFNINSIVNVLDINGTYLCGTK